MESANLGIFDKKIKKDKNYHFIDFLLQDANKQGESLPSQRWIEFLEGRGYKSGVDYPISFFYRVRFRNILLLDKVSISSTFYTQLFHMKVLHKAILYLHFRLELLLAQEYWRKCAHIMLVKLTQGE